MKEPLYRWVCTMCGISAEAEGPEMARLNIDVHVQLAHPSTRERVRVQPDPGRDQPARERGAGDEWDEDSSHGPADEADGRGSQP